MGLALKGLDFSDKIYTRIDPAINFDFVKYKVKNMDKL